MPKKKENLSSVEKKIAKDEVRLAKDVGNFEVDEIDFQDTQKEVKEVVKILRQTGFKEFVVYLNSPWRIVWSNFLGGIFRGLGIIIGMTVVFAILIWALGKIVDFPLIGEYFLDLKNLLEQFAPANGYR